MSRQIRVGGFVLVAVFASVYALNDLPSYFPRCKRNDPNLNECMVKAGNALKPYLVEGIAELNLRPISPYRMPELVLEQGTSAINFKGVMSNCTVYGLDTYEVKEMNYDTAKGIITGRLTIKGIVLKGHYNVDSKILGIPLSLQGNQTAIAKNLEATLYQEIKLIKRKGVEYIKTDNLTVNVKVNPKDVTWMDETLTNSGSELSKITQDVVIKNLDILVEEMEPAVMQVLAKMMRNMLEKIHTKIPYDQLYPLS